MPATKKPMPAFTKAPEEMVRLFENALKDFPMATTRKMFGYPCAFVNGNMFTGLFQDEMFLRLSDKDRAAIRKEYGTPLFEPMPGRPMREYGADTALCVEFTRVVESVADEGDGVRQGVAAEGEQKEVGDFTSQRFITLDYCTPLIRSFCMDVS